jgi:hypothetical protein
MNIARTYIELAHGIERHSPGYIDGYFGPKEWKTDEKRPLEDLAHEAEALAQAVETLADETRRDFLAAQVRAMRTTIALLMGEAVPYREEVRLLYDIEAERVPEERFERAIAALDDLLPGKGEIAPREQAFRAKFEVGRERLPELIEVIVAELRERTLTRFSLPEGESFEVQLVEDKPWGGYNWYLGDYRSRIDINTDLPSYLTGLPELVAHEAYPGHHTEHAVKEWRLVREAERLEHAVLLINAPECVLSEGIAMHALSQVMTDEELRDWLERDLAARANVDGAEVGVMLRISEAKKGLRGVRGNAALSLHEEHMDDEEVQGYLERYGLMKPEEAKKAVEFLKHPTFRSYTFTYTAGAALLDSLFAKGDPRGWFGRLLAEPLTPARIRGWL